MGIFLATALEVSLWEFFARACVMLLMPFIIAWDEDEQTSQRYNQQFNLNGVVPQVFIIDPQGDIVSRIEGYHGGEECRIIGTIAGLLEQSNLTLPEQCR